MSELLDILQRPLLVLWPPLLAGTATYVVFLHLWKRERLPRVLLTAAALVLALPWVAGIAYYTHLLDGPLYYEWRSWPATDFTLGGVGALVAVVFSGRWLRRPSGPFRRRSGPGTGSRAERPRDPGDARGRRQVLFGTGRTTFLVLIVLAKPALGILDPATLNDEWKDGVCIQTSAASCGACATATVLRALGEEEVTEREIARAARTASTGTLNWLLARVIRERGYDAHFRAPASPWEAVPPAILGVTTRGVGHFVVLLSVEEDRLVLGEPLSGREEITRDEFARRYRFDRFALEVAPRRP